MTEPLGVLVAFTAGLFSFLSPCVLPLFPSYLSFVTGMSVLDLRADLPLAARRRVMLHAIAFVTGFSAVFVALGASLGAASGFLFDYRDGIRRVGGLLIVVFGLYLYAVFAGPEAKLEGRRDVYVRFAASMIQSTRAIQLVDPRIGKEALARVGQVQPPEP
jgi:cytochrome c-type biogenesis protein